MMMEARFPRRFDSLPAIFALTSGFFAAQRLDPDLLPVVDLAVEELFTNMVKYSRESTAEVRIALKPVARGVEVTLVDYDVDPFDVTLAPDVDVTLPAERRRPGGLGLFLVKKMVDSLEYRYQDRESHITFRKTTGEPHVRD